MLFLSSRKKEKSIGEIEKLERKRGRGRSIKISPALSPMLVCLAEGGFQVLGYSTDLASGGGV